MSNETVSDQKQPAPKAKPDALTRIPVKHLYFAENIDLPGGNGQVSNKETFQNPPAVTRYFSCDFIPAWQQFELTYHAGGNTEPEVQLIPACHVRRWRRL